MDPQIVDAYNDEPQGVHVIDRLNDEYEGALSTIKRLETENEQLRMKYAAFKAPTLERDKRWEIEDMLTEKFTALFMEICDGDETNSRALTSVLMSEYGTRMYPLKFEDGMLIKKLSDMLDEATNHQNPEWCRMKVITTCEYFGISSGYTWWGTPEIEIEKFSEALARPEINLSSLTAFI